MLNKLSRQLSGAYGVETRVLRQEVLESELNGWNCRQSREGVLAPRLVCLEPDENGGERGDVSPHECPGCEVTCGQNQREA